MNRLSFLRFLGVATISTFASAFQKQSNGTHDIAMFTVSEGGVWRPIRINHSKDDVIKELVNNPSKDYEGQEAGVYLGIKISSIMFSDGTVWTASGKRLWGSYYRSHQSVWKEKYSELKKMFCS